MNSIARKALFATAIFLVFVAIVRCQTITFEPHPNTPASETKPDWKLSFSTTFQNKLETDNKLTLIDAPVTFTSAGFTKTDRFGVTQLRSNLAFTHKRSENNQYYGFVLDRTQRLNQTFNLRVGGSYHFTRSRRFATAYSSLNAKIFEAESNPTSSGRQLERSEVFSKVEYFVPTESGFNISKGFTVSGGWENRFRFGRIWLQPTAQFILDNGALQRGQRTIGNVDFTISYRFNKLCVGGGLDYSRFFSGRPQERNSTVGKFFVSYN